MIFGDTPKPRMPLITRIEETRINFAIQISAFNVQLVSIASSTLYPRKC